MRQLHPDVNPGKDTTAAAVALNAAYQALLDRVDKQAGEQDIEKALVDVFDEPEAEPTEVFINPFACPGVDPFMWEELQEATQGAADPAAALASAGVILGSESGGAAVEYVTPAQLRALRAELERMSTTMDSLGVEVASCYVWDCVLRARVANNRVWARQ
jgi:curved DNA-binding protein CbpA